MASTETFDAFLDDYFQARFEWDPSAATDAGIHDYDHLPPDRSAKAHLDRVSKLQEMSERSARLRTGELTEADQIDLELVEGRIRDELLDLETLQDWRHNPIAYMWLPGRSIDGLLKRSFASPEDRLQTMIHRLGGVAGVIQAMKSNLDNPPESFTQLALRMARSSVDFFGTTIDRWAREAADGDTALLARFTAVQTEALDAIANAADWLEKDLLPRSRGEYAIGAEAFRAKLQCLERTDLPLSDLGQIAEANLERDSAHFIEAAARLDADRTPSEVMQMVSQDHPSEETLLASARDTIDAIVGFLRSRDLITIPENDSLSVVETPPYYRFGAFAAMDAPGAFEPSAREAYYYVTPPEPDWDKGHKEEHLRLFNRPTMEIITIHEAYPGHYVHLMNAPRFPTRTRRLIMSGSNVEGWAHYAEQAVLEEGYRKGDLKLRLAQLQEALLRDCRFVVSIGLHTGSMSLEDAERVFVEKGFQEPSNAREEARRGTFDPTYLSYTLGKLQIYKLRDDWKKHTGSEDIKAFHDSFVLEGGLPIRLLRRRMLGHDEASTLYDPDFYRTDVSRS